MSYDVKQWLPVDQVQAAYKEKLVTADEAVKIIESGDYVHYGLFTGVVVDLDTALAKRVNELTDVTICSTMWSYKEPPMVLQADPNAEHFRYSSTHFTPTERNCNKAGNCWFLPVQFRENPKFWEECRPRFKVAMLQVAPMDASGNFNFGPQVAEYWGILKNADYIVHIGRKNTSISDVNVTDAKLVSPITMPKANVANSVTIAYSGENGQQGMEFTGNISYAGNLGFVNCEIEAANISGIKTLTLDNTVFVTTGTVKADNVVIKGDTAWDAFGKTTIGGLDATDVIETCSSSYLASKPDKNGVPTFTVNGDVPAATIWKVMGHLMQIIFSGICYFLMA